MWNSSGGVGFNDGITVKQLINILIQQIKWRF